MEMNIQFNSIIKAYDDFEAGMKSRLVAEAEAFPVGGSIAEILAKKKRKEKRVDKFMNVLTLSHQQMIAIWALERWVCDMFGERTGVVVESSCDELFTTCSSTEVGKLDYSVTGQKWAVLTTEVKAAEWWSVRDASIRKACYTVRSI